MLVDVVRKLMVVAGSLGVMLAMTQAQADGRNEICLTYANGQFEPKEPTVPADAPLTIRVKNLDAKAMEFESETLKIEKVVAGNSEAVVTHFHLTSQFPIPGGSFNAVAVSEYQGVIAGAVLKLSNWIKVECNGVCTANRWAGPDFYDCIVGGCQPRAVLQDRVAC